MTIEEQVAMMEGQLAHFDSLMEKLMYLTDFFGPDPEFTKEATDIVRNNIARSLR